MKKVAKETRGCAICWHFKPTVRNKLLVDGKCTRPTILAPGPMSWPDVRWHDRCPSWRTAEPLWLATLWNLGPAVICVVVFGLYFLGRLPW